MRGEVRSRVLNGSLPQVLPVKGPAKATDSSSAWIERFIVTTSGAERERARLERSFGPPDRSVTGVLRFSRRTGIVATEVTVNESTGLVERVRTSQNGDSASESVREYSRGVNGTYVLSGEQMLSFDISGKRSRQTVMTRYRNVRIVEDK